MNSLVFEQIGSQTHFLNKHMYRFSKKIWFTSKININSQRPLTKMRGSHATASQRTPLLNWLLGFSTYFLYFFYLDLFIFQMLMVITKETKG